MLDFSGESPPRTKPPGEVKLGPPLMWRVYDPGQPEHINIVNPHLHISGIVKGPSRNNLSTNAIGITTRDERTRITLVDGLPAQNEFERETNFQMSSAYARAIAETEIGSWPKLTTPILPSITTDIVHLPNGNYLVGAIGSKDTFSIAFVPNENGRMDRASIRIIYANPFIDPNVSHVDIKSGDIVQESKHNPYLMPSGTILLSFSYGGLLELASAYNLTAHSAVQLPEILHNKREVEGSLRSFFRPIIQNMNDYGPQILDTLCADLSKQGSTDTNVAIVTTRLDPTKQVVNQQFAPSGKEYMLMNSLMEGEFKPLEDKLRSHPYVEQYGMDIVEKLIADIERFGLQNDEFYRQVLIRAKQLAPPHFLPDSIKKEVAEMGISIPQVLKYRRNNEHADTFGEMKSIVQRENKAALNEKLLTDWEIFGVGKQQSRILGAQRTYSGEFRNLIHQDIPEFITQRKQMGLSTHTLDIMGPGIVEGLADMDSMTAVTIKEAEGSTKKHKNLNIIKGNIYSNKAWKKISERARLTDGFDVIFCRPVGPFERRIMPLPGEDPSRLVNAELVLFKSFLERTYEVMSRRNSTLLFTLPDFMYFGIDESQKEASTTVATNKMIAYLAELKDRGFDITPAKSDFDKAQLHVYKIVKHSDSPTHLR